MVTKAQQRANAKYRSKSYDRAEIVLKKGQRDKIKAYAESQGLSLNAYISRLIENDMGDALHDEPKQTET